jgi:hypothetical protein
MIRQSLGRSTLNYLRSHTNESEAQIEERLAKLLHLFFPKTPKEDIENGISKFVNKALTFKREVMEEQALYQFHWIYCGESFDSISMETVNEIKGVVALCAFPGLTRIIKDNDKQKFVRVVRATALMENMLDQ